MNEKDQINFTDNAYHCSLQFSKEELLDHNFHLSETVKLAVEEVFRGMLERTNA